MGFKDELKELNPVVIAMQENEEREYIPDSKYVTGYISIKLLFEEIQIVAFHLVKREGSKMARENVTKEELETIVNFNEAADTTVIYTFNNDLKKKRVAFSKKYPGLCRMTVDDADFGSVTYANRKS